MNISAPHLGNLINYASYRGVDEFYLRGFLTDSKLDLWNSKNSVTENEFLTLFSEMISSTEDPYFGLHYGCYLNINAMRFIAELSTNATHIEQVVFILQNYIHNSFPIASLIENKEKHYYMLKLESSINDAKLKNQILDTVYSFLFREFQLMCTDKQLPGLILPYEDLTEYSDYLDSNTQNGNSHCFLFQPEILKSKINKKKTTEIELLLPKFLQMLDQERYNNRPFSNMVRKMVLQLCKPDPPTFEQVVVHFPVSDRTFQRKLKDEGLSFRKITNEIKNELSTYLSKGNNMKTQDIAHILGYSEPSAYLHAVKRWHT